MRGAAAVESVRGAAGRRPLAVDAALAVALAASAEGEILTTDVAGPLEWLVPLGLLATLPVALRRRLPLVAVVLVIVGIVTLDWVSRIQEPQSTLLPYLLVVYSAGAHAPRAHGIAALVIAVTGLTIDEPGDMIVLGPLSVATWLTGRLVRSWRRQAVELARLAGALERERSETARLAVVDERARIARDLHDVVGHGLSLLVLQAGAERLSLGDDRSGTREALAAIERSGRSTLTELRRLVGVLRSADDDPELAPLPGLARLDDLARQVRDAGLPVHLQVDGEPVPLPPGLDVAAYRVVQEALTNALRHAQDAHRVCIRVGYGPRELTLEIADDGRPGAEPRADAHGLVGMRERVALYGGRLTAGPGPEGGFVVTARLPRGDTP
jgi:signal transduction histidine kinase